MKTKYIDIIMYLVISLIGVLTIQQVQVLPEATAPDVGPAYLPVALAIFMIALSVVGLIQTVIRSNSNVMSFPGLFKIIVTIISLVVFLFVWETFGYFYFLSTILLAGLLIFYNNDGVLTRKIVMYCILGSVVTNILLYLFFTYVLYTKF